MRAVRRRFTLKDTEYEKGIFASRLAALVMLIGVAVFILVARLFYVQIIDHDHYTTLSRDNRVKLLPIPPPRGKIFSRDGLVLADNYASFSLEVVPESVADLELALRELNKIITLRDIDIDRFKKSLQRKRRFEVVSLKTGLTEREVARFSVDRHLFPGFSIAARLHRNYPHAAQAAHIVGYVGRINEEDRRLIDRSSYSGTTHIGKTGVEKTYEPVLHGEVGYEQVEVNAQGRVLRVLERKPPIAGKDLFLTVDMGLQNAAINALGDRRGAVVAVEPTTGDILALVSAPSFDPNPFVNGIDPKQFNALLESRDKPMFNRAVQGQYPPGSTIKPFIGSAALSVGLTSHDDRRWCPGWFSLPWQSHQYRCWRRGGHGSLNMSEAIAQSCDVYFYKLALDLGIDRLYGHLRQFGFGQRLDIDIPGEASGLLPSREWKWRAKKTPWYPGDTLIAGIGQGYMLATPLQLAAATAMLGTHGRRFKPRLVASVGDPHDPPREVAAEGMLVPGLKPPQWDYLLSSMLEVVYGVRGTARHVGGDTPYRFAGKTGTSQLFKLSQTEEIDDENIDERLRDHALFIAFAPVEAPSIALAVIVENGGGGGAIAAPIARTLLDHYLRKTLVRGGGES